MVLFAAGGGLGSWRAAGPAAGLLLGMGEVESEPGNLSGLRAAWDGLTHHLEQGDQVGQQPGPPSRLERLLPPTTQACWVHGPRVGQSRQVDGPHDGPISRRPGSVEGWRSFWQY